jgi:NADPH-dependent 2,4-dienoyl-CoA reductase/sulfur reductase-like enzyme
MSERLLVIGADAAGMSAAHQALRTARAHRRSLEVVALEASGHTSYSACGIPYLMSGDVAATDNLIARSAEEHRAAGIDLRMRHEAMGLDLRARVCEVRDHERGHTSTIAFDQVMIATGAAPVVPAWAAEHPRVHAVKTLDDAATWARLLADRPRTALVAGGGYIGAEAAEAFACRGVRTTLVTRGAELMSATLEPGTAQAAQAGLEKLGVEVITGSEISGVVSGPGEVRAVCAGGEEYPADVIALGLGVTPRVDLARQAGLPLGDGLARGALVPDERQQVADGVWAAGDCVAVRDRLLGEAWYVPLGTHANKCGRVAGTNIGGGQATFPGSVGTAITRAGQVEVARTGLMPLWASERLGLEVATKRLDSTTISGYMPGAAAMTVWVMADVATGRLLGGQISGGLGAGKRIDTLATALFAGMTAQDVAYLDLAYAPPFSPTWDPVQIACRSLAERIG